jgi:hypothetical protein
MAIRLRRSLKKPKQLSRLNEGDGVCRCIFDSDSRQDQSILRMLEKPGLISGTSKKTAAHICKPPTG